MKFSYWQSVAIYLRAQCAIRLTPHFVTAVSSILIAAPARSQIEPDRTLPVNSIVIPNGNNFTINGGSRAGGNLFHSFKEFSLTTGGEAFFNNAVDIQNIFSRITGGNLSHIDGLIRANGAANLFLINPNGIIFGPNARLDIGGSFFATTANSIKFADEMEFRAIDPATSPLLTISVPIGLQFGQNPGKITVQGSGYNHPGNHPTGLQIEGNTLALIGGEVNFSNGMASVKNGGHLEVGSVSNAEVKLNSNALGWIADYSGVSQFNDIHLAQQSLIHASGSQGSIQLHGRNINLSEGSAVRIQNLGTQSSGDITVNATESLNLTGNIADGTLGSLIEINNLGTAKTGNIRISARQLSIQNGGAILTTTYTEAPGGNVTVHVANSSELDGLTPANPYAISMISTFAQDSGNAGNLTISTGNLRLSGGANITSISFSSGQAGEIQVNAQDSIEIVGKNPLTLITSGINSSTFSSGNANNVTINTSKLAIRDGGALSSSTLATGSAGSVTINASESVEVIGSATGSIVPSGIASTALIVDLVTQLAYEVPSVPTGNAASLIVNTPSLRIADAAYVTVRNDGPGKAGDLLINANSISINNQGSITASTASGNGGNIILNLQTSLLMHRGSFISATAAGTGNGGNVAIAAPVIVGLENSDIVANANLGNGGNIQIATQGIFGLKNRSEATLGSDITASSRFGVSGTVAITNPELDTRSILVPLPQNLVDTSEQITSGCAVGERNTFTVTGRGGLPEDPTSSLLGRAIWWDDRDLSIRRQEAGGRRREEEIFATPIDLNQTTAVAPQKLPKNEPTSEIVEASGWMVNTQGQVELVANNNNNHLWTKPINCQLLH